METSTGMPGDELHALPRRGRVGWGLKKPSRRQHSNHAGRSSETVDGKSYDKLFLAIDGYTISLLSHAGEERPYRMSVSNGQKLVLQVDYDTYLRDLEPQMSLFEPPRNTRIAELQGP